MDTRDSDKALVGDFKSKLSLIKKRAAAVPTQTAFCQTSKSESGLTNPIAVSKLKSICQIENNEILSISYKSHVPSPIPITEPLNVADTNCTTLAQRSSRKEKSCYTVRWACEECSNECLAVNVESRCICGHRLKAHNRNADLLPCLTAKCPCSRFFFVVAEGAWVLRCRCKHKHTDHDSSSVTHKCLKCSTCKSFDSPWVCNCGHTWGQHSQMCITITSDKSDIPNESTTRKNFAVRQDGLI